MSGNTLWLLLLLMAVVTYIPRLLPALFVGKIRFSGKAEKFLRLVPYTAMAALVFPGVFTASAVSPAVGVLGVFTAGAMAYFRCPLVLCVLAAIAVELGAGMIF